jgi:hypothetical protein
MLELIGLYAGTAMRETSGTASLSNARRFAPCSRVSMVSPGRLRPRWTRLDTSPTSTGTARAMNATGTLVVACIAARASGVPGAMMTSTLSQTNSAATA